MTTKFLTPELVSAAETIQTSDKGTYYRHLLICPPGEEDAVASVVISWIKPRDCYFSWNLRHDRVEVYIYLPKDYGKPESLAQALSLLFTEGEENNVQV